MKKLTFVLLAALTVTGTILTMQSCSDSAKKFHYDVPYHSGAIEVTIPPSNDTTNVNNVSSGPTHFNVDSLIKAKTNNNLSINNITSVKLTSVKLTLLDGTATNNFANFQSAYASFYSNSNNTPYQVSIPNNPDVTSYELNLPVDPNAELKSYMTGNTFYYAVGGKLRRPTTASLKCKIEFTYNITVNN